MPTSWSYSEEVRLKEFGLTILDLLGVTWRHKSRDHCTRNMRFPISGQYGPTVHLTRFLGYEASELLGSRPWPFGFTWRHRSRDHWTRNVRFLIGSQYEPTMYLTRLLRCWAFCDIEILGSPWPFGDTRRHLSVIIIIIIIIKSVISMCVAYC